MAAVTPPDFRTHIPEVLGRVRRWSRTVASGNIDTSTSAKKARDLFDSMKGDLPFGTATQQIAAFETAVVSGCEFLADNHLGDLTPDHLIELNEKCAGSALGGRLRTHEKPEFEYLACDGIVEHLTEFCERLRNASAANSYAAVRDILFDVHWSVDLRGHYFADGCGRTAVILGSWVTHTFLGALMSLPARSDYLAIAIHDEPMQEWRRLVEIPTGPSDHVDGGTS